MKIKVNSDAKWYIHNGKFYPIIDGEVEIPEENEKNNSAAEVKEEKKKK